MGRTWRKRALAGVLAIGSAALGLAVVPLAPAHADTGSDSQSIHVEPEDRIVRMLDTPALPAWVTFAGGKTLFTGESKIGAVGDEYGHDPNADYSQFSEGSPYASDLANVTFSALGDADDPAADVVSEPPPLDAQGHTLPSPQEPALGAKRMDAAAITGSGAPGSPARLNVLGPQALGYPARGSIALNLGEIRGVSIMPGLDGSLTTDSAARSGKIVVIGSTGWQVFRMDGNTIVSVGPAKATLYSDPSFPGDQVRQIDASEVLDFYARPTWDRYAHEYPLLRNLSNGHTAETATAAVVYRASDGNNHLPVRILWWEPSANQFNTTNVFLPNVVRPTSAANVTGARIRYDLTENYPNIDDQHINPAISVIVGEDHNGDGVADGSSQLTRFLTQQNQLSLPTADSGPQNNNHQSVAACPIGPNGELPGLDAEAVDLWPVGIGVGQPSNSGFTTGCTSVNAAGNVRLEVRTAWNWQLDTGIIGDTDGAPVAVDDGDTPAVDEDVLLRDGFHNLSLGVKSATVQVDFPCAHTLQLQDPLPGASFDCALESAHPPIGGGPERFQAPMTTAAHVAAVRPTAGSTTSGDLILANRSWGPYVDNPAAQCSDVTAQNTPLPDCLPKFQASRADNFQILQSGLSLTGPPPVMLPLRQQDWKVAVELDDPTPGNPDDPIPSSPAETGDPIPLALLVAPPTVEGADQQVADPEFAKSSGNTQGSSVSTTESHGVSIGVNGEIPGFGLSASAGFEDAVTEESSISKTVTRSDFYDGTGDDHTLVYRTMVSREFTGKVVASSTGISSDGRTESFPIRLPARSVITAQTLTGFRDAHPTAWGRYGASLESAAHATVGNPGSYLPYDQIDGYCGVGQTPLPTQPTLPDNPFIESPEPLTSPDTLIGNEQLASANVGASVVSGSGFDIEDSQGSSRVAESSVSASVEATAAFVSLGYDYNKSWGAGTSVELSTGVSFSGGVGSIPDPLGKLSNEDYNWKSFLCKRNVGSPGSQNIPMWVLNYAVDGYGGFAGTDPALNLRLETAGPISLTSPIQSNVASRLPTFTWSQDDGTIQDYRVELEAVGANDTRSWDGVAPAANRSQANDRHAVSAPLASMPSQNTPLRENQLYRWRTIGHSYQGDVITSPYEFFVTDGPPENPTIDLPGAPPAVGNPVTINVVHNHITNITYTYECSFGDGTATQTFTSDSFSHTYAFPGLFQLRCVVHTDDGNPATDPDPSSNPVTTPVPVGPNANDDHYTVDEDHNLVVSRQQGVLHNDPGAQGAVLGIDVEHGTLDLASDGSFTYQPDANYCGTDHFSYGATGPATVRPALATIDVTCVNDPPVATDVTFHGTEDQAIVQGSFSLMGTVTDVEETEPQLLSIQYVNGSGPDPAKGTLTSIDEFGGFTYTPKPNYCNDGRGPDSFKVRAFDGHDYSNPFTVTLDIACVADPPTAVADPAITLDEDTSATLRPTDNDTDVDGPVGALTPRISTPSSHGATVTVATDGTVTYAPAADYCGPDSFGYRAKDADGSESLNEVTIEVTVRCVNDPPTGAPGTATVVEDSTTGTPLTPSSVLTDVEDHDLDITVTDGPDHGSVHHTGSTWTYTPAADFCGTDAVTFTGTDDEGETAQATFTITVTCVNDPPVSHPDEVHVNEDGTVTVNPVGNDTDVDGDTLTVDVVDPPDHGTLTNDGGVLTYTPDHDFCGTDSFVYRANDGTTESGSASVDITIACVNDAPVINPDLPVVVTEDGTVTSDPTGNDVDVDGDDLHPVITTQPQHGDVVIDDHDVITYTPDPNYCGTDTYGYEVTDGHVSSPEVLVTVTITCVNDAPVAGDDAPTATDLRYRMDQGGPPLSVTAPGVLSNDTDVEGDPLTATVATQPAHGTVVMNPNGSFTYTPASGFYGLDSFTYQVSDGHGGTDTGTVTIRVRGITKMTAAPVILTFNPKLKLYLGTFQAKLTDNAGNPVAGKTVVFTLGLTGSVACTAVTQADGTASCSANILNLVLALLGPPRATFTGDDTMIGSTATSKLLT